MASDDLKKQLHSYIDLIIEEKQLEMLNEARKIIELKRPWMIGFLFFAFKPAQRLSRFSFWNTTMQRGWCVAA